MGASWAACRERNRALRPHSWERERGTLQPVGALRSPGWKGWRTGATSIGWHRALQPAGTAGVPKPPDSVLQPLLHCPSGLSGCPCPSTAGGFQLPQTLTQVFLAHPGWEEAFLNPLCLPHHHLPGRVVHTTPQLISTARKTSKDQPPPLNPSSFRSKGFRARASGSARLPSGRRLLSRSPSQHPTARAQRSTYSPGPC